MLKDSMIDKKIALKDIEGKANIQEVSWKLKYDA